MHIFPRSLFESSSLSGAILSIYGQRMRWHWIHAYDPEIIVMGGGVMESASVIIPYIESCIHQYSWTPWGGVHACAYANWCNNAALLGAVPLISES